MVRLARLAVALREEAGLLDRLRRDEHPREALDLRRLRAELLVVPLRRAAPEGGVLLGAREALLLRGARLRELGMGITVTPSSN